MYLGYPTETRVHWPALHEDFHRVDAVYENKRDHIFFFIGIAQNHWHFKQFPFKFFLLLPRSSILCLRKGQLAAARLPEALD